MFHLRIYMLTSVFLTQDYILLEGNVNALGSLPEFYKIIYSAYLKKPGYKCIGTLPLPLTNNPNSFSHWNTSVCASLSSQCSSFTNFEFMLLWKSFTELLSLYLRPQITYSLIHSLTASQDENH